MVSADRVGHSAGYSFVFRAGGAAALRGKIYQGEGEEDEEDGIYLMSQYIDIPDEVALHMTLTIEILTYVCWLGCKAENDYFPQDLELVIGDKIPDFISFLEENLTGKEDFKQAIDFVNKNLCY